MAKEFKKGQTVVHFASWDDKGTWYFRRAVVQSCGVKQMTLEDAETGEMMGRHFRPNSQHEYTQTWQGEEMVRIHQDCTKADMTDEEAHAICIEMAKRHLEEKNAHYARCLAGNHGEHYDNSIRRSMAELHEPRSRAYSNRAE